MLSQGERKQTTISRFFKGGSARSSALSLEALAHPVERMTPFRQRLAEKNQKLEEELAALRKNAQEQKEAESLKRPKGGRPIKGATRGVLAGQGSNRKLAAEKPLKKELTAFEKVKICEDMRRGTLSAHQTSLSAIKSS